MTTALEQYVEGRPVGPEHPWRLQAQLRERRAEWRQMAPWASDDSVGAFVARGGEVTECAARDLPEILASEDVIVASDEWPLSRKLSHSSDTYFLNIGDWMGVAPDPSRASNIERHGAVAWTGVSRPGPLTWDREPTRHREPPPVVEQPWFRKDRRHATVEPHHATLNEHAVKIVGIIPRVGETLPPAYRFKGRLIQLKRCIASRPCRGAGATSLWSFDRMGFHQRIRWAWIERGAHQPKTTTAFWTGRADAPVPAAQYAKAKPRLTREQRYQRNTSAAIADLGMLDVINQLQASVAGLVPGAVQPPRPHPLQPGPERTITHRIVDGRSVPV